MSGEKKMMAPNTGLWWIDKGVIDTSAVSVGDITTALSSTTKGSAALNISPAVMAGYTLNSTGSDTKTSQGIIDTGAGQSRGYANYGASIPFFVEADPTTNTTSDYLAVYNAFKEKGRDGYLMRRIGKHYDVALDVGDIVELYLVKSWTPRITEPDDGGDITFTVPFLQQGFIDTYVTLVA